MGFSIGGCGCSEKGIGSCGCGRGGSGGCRLPDPGAPGCCQEAPYDEGLFVPPIYVSPVRARLIERTPMRDEGLFTEPVRARVFIGGECLTYARDESNGLETCVSWWGSDRPRTVASQPAKTVRARIISPPRVGLARQPGAYPGDYSRHKATFLEYPATKARVSVVPGRRR